MIETLDGRAIGSCGYFKYSGRNRSCDVGIWIGEADARGQGYGTEAMRLLLWYLFRQMGLHRVALLVLSDNAAAIASYRKCGFREEGRDREAVFKDGGWVDSLRMGVLEHEAILSD
jgi:RimJ/RimL family protein N-acetyltransferase